MPISVSIYTNYQVPCNVLLRGLSFEAASRRTISLRDPRLGRFLCKFDRELLCQFALNDLNVLKCTPHLAVSQVRSHSHYECRLQNSATLQLLRGPTTFLAFRGVPSGVLRQFSRGDPSETIAPICDPLVSSSSHIASSKVHKSPASEHHPAGMDPPPRSNNLPKVPFLSTPLCGFLLHRSFSAP